MRVTVVFILVLAVLMFGSTSAAQSEHHQAAKQVHVRHHHARSHPLSVKAYARKAAASVGWTGTQWDAIDEIVTPESHWNPCAYNPSKTDCHYVGTASCGIPQAQPCPVKWQHRLWETRYRQIWYLIHYIKDRYGSPINALVFRRANGWY